MSGKTYIEKKSLLKTLNQNAIIPVKVKGNEDDSSFSDLQDGYILLENFPAVLASLETITPVVTAGTGSVDDFSVMCYRLGNKIMYNGLCPTCVIPTGEVSLTVELTLPAAFAPTSNFTSRFQFYGGATYSSDLLSAIAIQSSTGTKKLQIDLSITDAASGDFGTTISFSGSIEA